MGLGSETAPTAGESSLLQTEKTMIDLVFRKREQRRSATAADKLDRKPRMMPAGANEVGDRHDISY